MSKCWKKSELLVYGYIRKMEKKKKFNVPQSLYDKFLMFYPKDIDNIVVVDIDKNHYDCQKCQYKTSNFLTSYGLCLLCFLFVSCNGIFGGLFCLDTFNDGQRYERESTYETCQVFDRQSNHCTYECNCDSDDNCSTCDGTEFCYDIIVEEKCGNKIINGRLGDCSGCSDDGADYNVGDTFGCYVLYCDEYETTHYTIHLI